MKIETRVLVLIAVAIVINIIVGQIAVWMKLPIYVDAIGTVLVAVLAGPLAGGITGLLTNIIWGLILDPGALWFFPVSLVIGVVAGLLARAGWFRNLPKIIVSGVVIAVLSTIVAIPIIVYVYGGVTGAGTDFLTAYMVGIGQKLLDSVAVSSLVQNLGDKVLTVVVAWAIIKRLPQRFISGFPFFRHSQA